MPRLHRLVSGLRACVWRSRGERELDEELRGYLATAIERKVSSGLSLDEATRAARVEMGSLKAVKDKVRDIGWETRVESLIRDLRFAVRSFLRAPRFTIPALVTLALGIGGTSAMFSVVREPLPYRDLDRIVAVWETNRGGTSRNVIAPSNFVAWRERTRTLEHLGMVGPATIAMIVDVQPVLGRAYAAEEDADDAVIVLSHDFWQRRLGGRRDVLDLTLSTHGGPRTVIGVMPAGFTVVGQHADFLMPPGQTPEQLRAVRGRGSSYAIARLRDGVSIEQARDEMRRIFSDLEKEAPELNAQRTVMLIPLQEQLIADLRPAIFALVGAVALVLLVACVNVANLLLARCAARERELGMRTALGAMRGRLVRQMLTESLVLSTAGGIAGLAVAALCHRGLLALVGDRIPVPRLDQLALDLPVVAFTLLTSLATG